MKITLRISGMLGLLLFGFIFILTFTDAELVEKSAKNFVSYQVEKEVRTKLSGMANTKFGQKAQALADRLGLQERQIQQNLADELPQRIATIMAQMCGYDCEKSKQLAKGIKQDYLDKLKGLKMAQFNLAEIVSGKYIETVSQLQSDIRVFAFSNATMFLILFILSYLKPLAIKQLFVPGLMLFFATFIATAFYIFGQNWLYTLIFNDYMGWSYLVYLTVIFALLLDIALNKCRITSEIFNVLGSASSNITPVIPC
ncbi:hypothetical protein OS175_10495 [Marinicella sp. S1101]|uniref:hypothetical protein n=1 Tax=Marinicella marina TaxID=2996016 RepID=UPI002260AF26|nr:hypothetical protein [Marinicella marina]MCX7554309.1 hypothetical protein [Marinicella marina]MDJ1138700.1 hypothetical protein [Marinicella marina]